MIYETIKFSIADNIATITLNRPERLNAMPPQMADEISEALDSLEGARVVLITGEGGAFCSEADLDEYDGERVVLDPFIREAILLELPSFPLCSEACPGIAPSETSAASGSSPGWQAGEDPQVSPPGHGPAADLSFGAPADWRGPGRANPFEVLRGLMTGNAEGGKPDADAGVARRPSPKEARKVSSQKSRNRPKIKSSIVGRAKK